MSDSVRAWVAGAALGCCLGPGAPAWAQLVQASAEQVIQEGLRREEQRGREQLKAAEPRADELTPTARQAAPSAFPQESTCFAVNELSLHGKDADRFGWLLDAAMPYLRRCVGVQGLSFIAAQLDAALRTKGFVTTRVALPPQNLQAGRLQIHVEAGRVAQVRMVHAGTAPGAPALEDERWGGWRNAFPLAPGDLLNVRDLEQGVENMKRLPSQQVATRLEPGDEPGYSIVYIERRVGSLRERVRGGITLDNSGGRALGRAQLSAYLAFDNPAGLNDVLTASLNTNAQQPTSTHRSQSGSLQYSVPWGYSLLTLSASNSRFAQYVQGTTVRFLSSGRSETTDARLQRTFWRSASTKLGAYAGVSTRRALSYLDDVEVIVQRRRTTNVEAGVSYRQLFEHASAEFDIGLRRGVSWQGAQPDFDSADSGGLTQRPRILSFSGALATDFKLARRPVQYSLSLRGQHTPDTTLSVDQFSIGGRGSVRGFDGDAVLLAESGFVLRNEFSTPLKLWDGVDTSLLWAIDYGAVWGPSDILLAGKRLAGTAIGLRGRWNSLLFDATLATPLLRPDGFTSRRMNLYLSLTHSF